MNFELGFGVCLYKTQNQSLFTGKAANRAFKVVNGILNFQIFLLSAVNRRLKRKSELYEIFPPFFDEF